jgi:hypothetical protein
MTIPRLRRTLQTVTSSLLFWAFPAAAQVALDLVPSPEPVPGYVSLNLVLRDASGSGLAALQWTLDYPAAEGVALETTAGAAATASGKTVKCAGEAGRLTCLLSGANANALGDGVLATINVKAESCGLSSLEITMRNALGASMQGDAVAVAPTAAVSVPFDPFPPRLTALLCEFDTFLTPGVIACQVNACGPAPAGGLTVSLASDDPRIQVPPDATIPAGGLSGFFLILIDPVQVDVTMGITASDADRSRRFAIRLLPPGTVAAQ